MGFLEGILLLTGVALAVLGFVLPAAKEETDGEVKTFAREEMKELVNAEMNTIRQHVDDVVDEAVGYAVEKTERSLERLTNEKIMAINEYSDTVLEEIHKNHEEAMFLYDMLNTKHDSLNALVADTGNLSRETGEMIARLEASRIQLESLCDVSMQSAETLRLQMEQLNAWEAEHLSGAAQWQESDEKEDVSIQDKESRLEEAEVFQMGEAENTDSRSEHAYESDSVTEAKPENRNEQILEMYRQGKSTVAIAKELGLGVGEVKLVIDLYRNS